MRPLKERLDQLAIPFQDKDTNAESVTMRYLNSNLISLLKKKFPGIPENLLLQISKQVLETMGPRIVQDTLNTSNGMEYQSGGFNSVDGERFFKLIKDE